MASKIANKDPRGLPSEVTETQREHPATNPNKIHINMPITFSSLISLKLRFPFSVGLIDGGFPLRPLSDPATARALPRKQKPVSADLIKENMEKCCP
jgi:hypothetical protein